MSLCSAPKVVLGRICDRLVGSTGEIGPRVGLVLLLLMSSCGGDFMGKADAAMSLDMAASPDLSLADVGVPPLPTSDLMPSACAPAPGYPAPPYGYRSGRIIEDLVFQGKHDANLSGRVDANDPVATLSLHDYHQDPSTKLLVLVACAMWCGPCVAEQPSLNTMFASYKPSGVAFLSVILENTSSGPSSIANLNSWGAAKNVPYDLAIDPAALLGPYFATPAFPMQMLIRTSDMRILWLDNGADPTRLQAQIDAALAGEADAGAPPPPPMPCDLGGASTADGGVLSFCDSCAGDGDCPTGYVCASDTVGGHFCARPCAVAEDCPQNAPGYPPFESCINAADGKGMVCRPVGGVCHAGGAICDWCRPDVASDCAGGTTCTTVKFTGERFCSQPCTVQASFDPMTSTWSYSGDSCPSGSLCTVDPSSCGSSCTLNGWCARDPKHAQLTCQAPTPG